MAKAFARRVETPSDSVTTLKEVRKGPDGKDITLELRIYNFASGVRAYIQAEDANRTPRMVAEFNLIPDNGKPDDLVKRRQYLKWLADVMPAMLMDLIKRSEEEGF